MPSEQELRQMLIYAVDDDPVNLKLLKTILQQNGYSRVMFLYSGHDLLKEINIEVPDLILLDIMMPGLSGYDVLEKVKSNPKWKHIPVIMITAVPLEENLEPLKKSFDLGAMDFVGKPFSSVELAARVRSALFLEKQRRDLAEALRTIRTLERLLPICSYCKKIRNENSSWQEVEVYITDHTDTLFSHSICPDCYEKYIKPQLDSLKPQKG